MTRKPPRKPDLPLVKITFRNASRHTDKQVEAIKTWLAGQTFSYTRKRGDHPDVMSSNYYG